MKYLRTLLTVLFTVVSLCVASAQRTLSVISNQIPGALSEYLRVNNSDIFYEVSEPDVEGDVSVMITMTFDVIKHNAHIGYFELKAQVLSYTNKTLIFFDADYTPHPENKVNHNPYVGQQLANAIKDPNKKKVTVTFYKILDQDEVSLSRFENEAAIITFRDSRIN